jgi:hypothetical protein
VPTRRLRTNNVMAIIFMSGGYGGEEALDGTGPFL